MHNSPAADSARSPLASLPRALQPGSALWRLGAGCYLLALGWLVLTPADTAGRVTGIVATLAHALDPLGIPFAISYGVLEFTANIALFVPFGVFAFTAIPLRAPAVSSTLLVIASGCLLSTGIELLQLIVPGRVSTPSDVAANTLGTALGVALVWFASRPRRPRGGRR